MSTESPVSATQTGYTVLVFGGVAVAIGVLAYFGVELVKSLTGGPDCATPGSACNAALSGYQSEFQTCANQFTQLMTVIAEQGSAPTPGQQSEIATLQSCMNTAAGNMASVAASYNQSWYDLAATLVETVVLSAIAFYGLRGMGNWIVQNKSRFQTKPADGDSAAQYIEMATIQYAVDQALITQSIASQWVSAAQGFTSDNTAGVQAFWSALETQQLVTSEQAAAETSFLVAGMQADEAATIDVLNVAPV